ncbi:DNA replication factor Cdt1 [Schistosoma japonicum]|uniref:DNA replication factor Cdt1 n=1 Tax=Schistosoma japonicum TaxID=6182 RepID=A0A4Z2D6X1_SCHJA|nr:DNA replication factor Cdt1 [Schistosoma japonicum]
MPNSRLEDYFRVSKTPKNVRQAKRTALDFSPERKVSSKSKRPAYQRFSHLAKLAEESATDVNAVKISGAISSAQDKTASSPSLCSSPKEKIVVQRKKRVQLKKVTKVYSPQLSNSTSENNSKLPAFRRFAYLTAPISSPELQSAGLQSCAETAESPVSSSTLDLTQTDLSVPVDLVLPHNLRVLLELFRSCDTVVSMLHNRKELCSFDKLQPAVQEIVRRNFEETHVGQFLTIYPMVYFLRYEKQLDKFTHRSNGNYVLVLSPNLRTDGTQIGHDSPSKGFLPFTGTRLIQRRNRFHSLLLNLVLKSHREFLISELGIDPSKLPEDSSLRRWHPKFPLESAVTSILPSPLPVRPSEFEQKITSAKDAVKAFQARALFREAETCHQISLSKQQLSPIPSPKKPAASPLKASNIIGSTVCADNVMGMQTNSEESTSKRIITSTPNTLKGVSLALLNKVRARENERRLLTELTYGKVSETRRAIYCRLPLIVTQVWSILRSSNARPVPLSTVAVRVADAHPSGISADAISEHLDVLVELAPCWIEKLNWSTVHLRLKDPERSVKDVIDLVKMKVAKDGVNI